MTNQKSIDTPSLKGRFGWERIGDDLPVPVILRTNRVRYCPTRIAENEIVKKYNNLPQNVFTCITLKSYYLTATEARLLNEINVQHCDQCYGPEFFTTSDVIISAVDIKSLSRYLNVAKQIYSKNMREIRPYYGLIKLVTDPTNPNCITHIPYIAKSYNGENIRFGPLKLVSSFADLSHTTPKGHPTDWDVMYFKMLYLFSGTGTQLDMTKDDRIIPLTGLIYSKTRTPIIFQDCDQ